MPPRIASLASATPGVAPLASHGCVGVRVLQYTSSILLLWIRCLVIKT